MQVRLKLKDVLKMEANHNNRFLKQSLYKITLLLLKVLPMIVASFYLLNVTLSYFDIDWTFLSHIASQSWISILFMYLTSYTFEFCGYHRMFLHYIVIMDIVNMIDYYIGIPISDLLMLMVYLIITGICLFIILWLYVTTHKRRVT